MKECNHECYVLSTTQQDRSMKVECRKCKRPGFVANPDKEEWKKASEAESESYF